MPGRMLTVVLAAVAVAIPAAATAGAAAPPAPVQVTSGDKVLASRTYTPSC